MGYRTEGKRSEMIMLNGRIDLRAEWITSAPCVQNLPDSLTIREPQSMSSARAASQHLRPIYC